MTSTKRDNLVAAAERLFYEQGFHATGIDSIVSEAGVVRMTLYNHFPSKDALVAEVLRQRHERFMPAIDSAVRNAAPGTATMALVDAHNAWLKTHGHHGCILVKAMGEFAAHNAEVYAVAREAKNDLRAHIHSALVKDGVDDVARLEGHIYLLLEGCNAAVPVLGAEVALRHTRAAVESILPNVVEVT